MKQANPINITHIDHLVIRVNDLENMIAFYRDVLGCKLERGPGEGGLADSDPISVRVDRGPASAGAGGGPDLASRDRSADPIGRGMKEGAQE